MNGSPRVLPPNMPNRLPGMPSLPAVAGPVRTAVPGPSQMALADPGVTPAPPSTFPMWARVLIPLSLLGLSAILIVAAVRHSRRSFTIPDLSDED